MKLYEISSKDLDLFNNNFYYFLKLEKMIKKIDNEIEENEKYKDEINSSNLYLKKKIDLNENKKNLEELKEECLLFREKMNDLYLTFYCIKEIKSHNPKDNLD